MDRQTKVLEFTSFCIEVYAETYKMTGTDVANLFDKKGILNYLFNNYDALHTQGKEYLVPFLHDLFEESN